MGKEVLTFHVRLAEIAPAIWRRFEIRAEGTFWHLHCAIQDSMPWKDYHLHEFRFPAGDRKTRIGITGFDEGEEELLASWETPLKDWFVAPPDQCNYVYDFGDHWEHTVTLESREPAEKGKRYPGCLAGERRCPPEDVGGPYGYSEFLHAMADRRHSEHRTFRQWIGGPWDPESFRFEDVVFSQPSARLRRAGLA